MNKPYGKLLLEIWKCRTLSNFGVFLLLPSLIWGSRQMLENSLTFVILFTTLSELFGYGGNNNNYTEQIHKIWLHDNVFGSSTELLALILTRLLQNFLII